MTIDETIDKEKRMQRINELEDKVTGIKSTNPQYHKQIAEWLEELKIIKEYDLEIPQHFTKEQSDWIKKYCIQKNKEFYQQGIDDCKSIVLQTLDNGYLIDTLWLRMEQLKDGENNEDRS